MPIAEVNAVNHVRKSRRVAQRVADRVNAGTLQRFDVDLAEVLFGRYANDAKLEDVGFLDPDLGLEALAEEYGKLIAWSLRRAGRGRVDELAEKLRAKFAAAREPGKRAPIFPDRMREERTEESERIIARDDAAAARIAAVHLNQRALYQGMTLALLSFVTDQLTGAVAPEFAHGTIKMGPVRDAECDKVIAKVRKR